MLFRSRFIEKDSRWKERYQEYSAEKLIYKLRDGLDSASFEAVLDVLMQ